MNVSVRFLAVSALAMLASSARPVAAQSVSQPGLQDVPTAVVPAGPVRSALAGSSDSSAPAYFAPVATSDSAHAAVIRGPTVASARVASHAVVSTTRGAPPALQNRTSNRNAVALMIVGGAALVVGSVIGDDAGTLVMLGGAGIGLYGLYLFLT